MSGGSRGQEAAAAGGGGQPRLPAPHDVLDEDAFEWEMRDSSTPFWQHAIAGSCAGVMEHVAMYPVDTVKTRMQASSGKLGFVDTFRAVARERGAIGLMRGSVVIGFGCVPAHVGLFSTYELGKASLMDEDGEEHQPIQAAACGAMATLVHDWILTPSDVVKQRLQMGNHSGAVDCVLSTWRAEGISAFYRSLPATLVMNVPYMGLLVASNESLKRFLHINGSDGSGRDASLSAAPLYFASAGVSGMLAATATLPLDVVKTRLQTQVGGLADASTPSTPSKPRYTGIVPTVKVIWQEEGARGFSRGLGPRVALAMPSAAICWGTYETIRMGLRRVSDDDDRPRAPASAASPSSSSSSPPAPPAPPRQPSATVAPVASAEQLEWEEWDKSVPFWQHAVAGSCAGVMEHVAMYPIDTVKTRMQAEPIKLGHAPPGAMQAVRAVLQESGPSGLMRGCFAIGAGCIPAHIGLFCTYEYTKAKLMNLETAEHQPARAAACGALATVVHDMIITPTDVVKQRLQLGRYQGTLDCVRQMLRHEGPRAFYRSLPTTLISECPFHGVLVASNESLKVILGLETRGAGVGGDGSHRVSIGGHFFSTGVSGMLAAVVTQPLDVVKTRLQTQNVSRAADATEVSVRYSGLMNTVRLIHAEEGVPGFFRGMLPRLLFAAPSAAMCWGTYEVIKAILKRSDR